jgi:hypothetical protein
MTRQCAAGHQGWVGTGTVSTGAGRRNWLDGQPPARMIIGQRKRHDWVRFTTPRRCMYQREEGVERRTDHHPDHQRDDLRRRAINKSSPALVGAPEPSSSSPEGQHTV